MNRHTGTRSRERSSGTLWVGVLRRSGENVPRAVALVVWLVGVLSIVSVLMPAERSRLAIVTSFVGGTTTIVAAGTTAAVGVAMMLLAGGLRRRQHYAWVAGLSLAVAATALHVLKGLDVEEATASAGLAVVLIATRGQFGAAADGSYRRWVPTAASGLFLLDIVLGLLALLANDKYLSGDASLQLRLRHVLLGLVGAPGPLHFADSATSDLIPAFLAGLGAITLIVVLLMLLARPHRRSNRTAEQDVALARLLTTHGDQDSLGWFATRDDRDLVLSPSGKAAVSYRVVGGVALAAGDPLGDPEAWPQALEAFLSDAASHAWVPAVMGCGERAGAAWDKAGLDVLELGDEAVVDVAAFSLEGRTMRGVRQAVARVARAGYRIDVRYARDVPEGEWATLRGDSRRWREGEVERGFSMALGRLGDPRDRDAVLVTACDADGHPRALMQFAPWGKSGLSLDVVRRDRNAENGVSEALIVAILQAAPRLGVLRVSLNFAVFRAALERGAELGAGPVARSWRRLLLLGSRWWQIEQLYRFNVKFGPEWVPRYLCFPGPRELPRVALAALRAEAFLHLPGEGAGLAMLAGRRRRSPGYEPGVPGLPE